MRGEALLAERREYEREDGQSIAEREGERDRDGFEQARVRECRKGGRPIRADERVQQPAEADARQREREDESEREHGSAEQRTEHPIPDELHQEEREANDARRGEHEPHA